MSVGWYRHFLAQILYTMQKQKFTSEFMLKGSSLSSIWNLISTPGGLASWFAPMVSADNDLYTFRWSKTEMRQARLTHARTNLYIRFHWMDEEPYTYFELRIVQNAVTQHLVLEITDWAEPDDLQDIQDLWAADVEKLRRIGGL